MAYLYRSYLTCWISTILYEFRQSLRSAYKIAWYVPGLRKWPVVEIVIVFTDQSKVAYLSGFASPTSQFLKWNARVLRTGSGQNVPAHAWIRAAQFSCSGRPKRENMKMCAPWTFPFKLCRTSCFRPARTEKWKAIIVYIVYIYIATT